MPGYFTLILGKRISIPGTSGKRCGWNALMARSSASDVPAVFFNLSRIGNKFRF